MPRLFPMLQAVLLAGFLTSCTSVKKAGVRIRISDQTIAHEILQTEFEAMGASEPEYRERLARLENIVEEAIRRIKQSDSKHYDPDTIKAIFSTIDDVLVENHYNVFIHTESLWDALSPGIPSSGGAHLMTGKMAAHRKAFPDATYFRFDCDTGTMIHLGVFDRLKLPVVMVETPKHNFLRWRISRDQHVNWDVNDSASYTDDEHRRGAPLTAGPFDRETEVRERYLQDMSRDELKGYHLAIAASVAKKAGRFKEAIEYFHKSIGVRDYVAMPRNNLAWMIATQPELQEPQLLELALVMARSAVEIRPRDNNIIDTLAAVHGARREFDEATRIEMSGAKSPSRIKAYREKRTPVEMDWRSESDQ